VDYSKALATGGEHVEWGGVELEKFGHDTSAALRELSAA
jgi:hypothetical protein